MQAGQPGADQVAEHDAEAPETMAGAHDQRARFLLDGICHDIEAKLDRRQRYTDHRQEEKKRCQAPRPGRQPDHCKEDGKPVQDGCPCTDTRDEPPGERQGQQNAYRHAEQGQREFGRTEPERTLDIRNARQPGTEGNRLQEEHEHHKALMGHHVAS
jgi:hypothetical protein